MYFGNKNYESMRIGPNIEVVADRATDERQEVGRSLAAMLPMKSQFLVRQDKLGKGGRDGASRVLQVAEEPFPLLAWL